MSESRLDAPEEETLFEKGDWTIFNPNKWGSLYDPGYSKITHKCKWWKRPKVIDAYHMIQKQTDCPHCGEHIPDEIQALWAMHNWDNLQNRPAPFPSDFYSFTSFPIHTGHGKWGHSTFYMQI